MSRKTLRFVLLLVAVFGALDIATLFAPLALALLAIVLYPCVLLIPPLRRSRPPAWIARGSFVLAGIGTGIWLISCLVVIRYSPTSSSAWIVGHGEVSYDTYNTFSPHFPGAPEFELGWRPTFMPIGCSYISMGRLSGGSSRSVASPTWPMAFCPLATALVLRALRRERIPVGHCQRCGYNLTGNVSGRCPECGTDVPQTAAAAESSKSHTM